MAEQRALIRHNEQVVSVKSIESRTVVRVEQNAVQVKNLEVVKVFQDGSSLVRTPLQVQSNGQTQFNIFANPSGEHWLIVNGVEEYSYTIDNVSGNWRIIWQGGFPLQTTDQIFFVKQ